MALVNYTRPNVDLHSKRFSDILDEFFNESLNYRNDSFMPSVDISETENQFDVSVSLPGMNKEDINVDLDNGHLTISGERKLESEGSGKNFHRVESSYGSFSRSFQLPDSIDEESITAKYENGILNITIAKSEEKVKKKIEIS
ncbi:MAG: Hsp20/alpha crystallin family protein [Gracilimonas sp.]|uniref:Hsp20/alpha crystallin family protein n=1 Tax=Gracilimonas TaxID=649462 RepID=UPI001B0EEBE6|nr:Hsp20/alpha crystallin family protein [Gracilimonas sp.]MBO6585747.1 Hsp20/alpha crystallin family protein [Gracilimonas sp.]MBO6616744.1 Hsp20/alpha crystallin family protein [Gracilimonas sp.]